MLGPNGTGQKNTARTKRAAPAEEQICPSNGSRFYHNARTMSNDFTMFSYRLCVREEACRAEAREKGRGNSLRLAFWINNPSGLPFGSTTPPACPWQATVSRGRDRASVRKRRAQCAVSKFASGQSPTGALPRKHLLTLTQGRQGKKEELKEKEAGGPPLSDGSDASYLVVMRMTVTLLPSAV